MKKWTLAGLVFGIALSVLSFLFAFIAPQFTRPGSFDDVVAVLIPILPGLLVVRGISYLFGGEITTSFYVFGHLVNILIFTLIGFLIGRLKK